MLFYWGDLQEILINIEISSKALPYLAFQLKYVLQHDINTELAACKSRRPRFERDIGWLSTNFIPLFSSVSNLSHSLESMILTIGLVTLVVFSSALADTPANCTYDDIAGRWVFLMGEPGGDRTIDCSNPSKLVTILLLVIGLNTKLGLNTKCDTSLCSCRVVSLCYPA